MNYILPLFASPVKVSEVDVSPWRDFVYDKELDRINNGIGWMSVDRRVLTDDEDFRGLHDELMNVINEYVYEDCGIRRQPSGGFEIETSWIVRNGPGDWSPIHYHANSLFSGCVYFDIPKDSGNFTIHKDPTHTNFLSTAIRLPIESYNEYNSMEWTFEVEEGMVLLFPSQFQHSVSRNLSNLPRYSLAFNIWYRGEVGDREAILTL